VDILSLDFGITEKSLPVNPVYRPLGRPLSKRVQGVIETPSGGLELPMNLAHPVLRKILPSIAPQRLGMGVLPVGTEVSSILRGGP
jgi:hypothetical protein